MIWTQMLEKINIRSTTDRQGTIFRVIEGNGLKTQLSENSRPSERREWNLKKENTALLSLDQRGIEIRLSLF